MATKTVQAIREIIRQAKEEMDFRLTNAREMKDCNFHAETVTLFDGEEYTQVTITLNFKKQDGV